MRSCNKPTQLYRSSSAYPQYKVRASLPGWHLTDKDSGFMFKTILKYRQKQEKIVDRRVRLLGEVINNIRAVKLYAYESHFEARISELREKELKKLKLYGLLRSLVTATFWFAPVLASIGKHLLA